MARAEASRNITTNSSPPKRAMVNRSGSAL
jgi:hypothetical protein